MNYHKDASCKECAYFFAVFQASKIEGGKPQVVGGQCRIRAPSVGFVPLPVVQQGTVASGGEPRAGIKIERCSAPPHVAPDYWCGEFKKRVL